ncbi:TonB-dependent receptor plug domain-containing protein [Mariprofundus ferrooxydans]|uniref:TonB-dependent receptor plug domain-containing protein n=1 Tax=Mariprofundus ferrooxydans TaxID=314344 RepID=UPI0003809423|nr:TonB-dependent receptor plug domain-containing protein [Mariprofundus ferrooxydans]
MLSGYDVFRRYCMFACLLPVMVATGATAVAAANRYSADDLLSMKIEDLVNVKVTTLSKHEEKYMSTAGAVFVISSDDIRRSGARSIPDALRLAPGLQVSQSNMNQFQIGIRGQTDFFTDLLLVMVDGRPIYTTTFSGVWWVAQNYPLQDIERIEIVRGPGGAVWGSNAVNGVINIITKNSGATQGLRITGGGGTTDKGFGNISFGSHAGNLDYRVYAMNELRGGGLPTHGGLSHLAVYPAGQNTPDFRRVNQQGFRMDWDAGATTRITLHGDAYQVKTGVANYWMPIVTLPVQPAREYRGLNGFNGKNMVFRLEKELVPDILFKGQLFYDQYKLHTQIMREQKETFDGDFQVDFNNVLSQNISLGTNIRRLRTRMHNTPQFQLPSRTTKLASFFINDELRLFDGLFRIIGGMKMERNSYTGWVYQPSARAIVSDDNWALWVSASQAARTPNDMENGLRWNLKSSAGKLVRQIGSGVARTEKVLSYEVGARLRPVEESLIELTAFKIRYKGVLDTWQNRSATNPYIINGIIPEYLTNVLNGEGDGFEANFRYNPWQWLTLKGSYTYLHQVYTDYPVKDGETIWTVRSNKGQDPANRFHLGVGVNPIKGVEFDTNLYFTGPFREGDIHGYHRLDMRLAWKPVEYLEVSLVGQDMLQASYQSNTDSIVGYAARIPQRYYAQVTYTYH